MALSRWRLLEGEPWAPTRLGDEHGGAVRVVHESSENARWLGTLAGEPLWGVPDGEVTPGEQPTIELESPAFDEIGVQVGPERDGGGLFDPPTTEGTDRTATRERTDVHGSAETEGGPPRRTAVLAWIAATSPPTSPVESAGPCEPLKRRIADEPLDMLPALEGLGPGRAPAAQEREDTATQIEGFEVAIERNAEAAPTAAPPADNIRKLLLIALAAAVAALVIQLLG